MTQILLRQSEQKSDHHFHHHHHPYSFSDHLNASLAEVGVEPAAEPILLVPLRLSMPDEESSYSVGCDVSGSSEKRVPAKSFLGDFVR